ncbi:Arc family DNA-binding protein [Sinorhizobium meliloti]|nr:Arc family DNA-binding protein [Sinorhizobium meliloti]MDX0348909.1 Arc family DNA-binding protein [Sinorhizobium meliloti]
MTKKARVRDYDQFIVRLPPGMRERIKSKAERAGMSMNEAIVWCLEEYFPAPATLEERIEGLAAAVADLKQGNPLEEQIDGIVDLIDKTLRDIAAEKIPTTIGFQERVAKMIEERDIQEYEALKDRPFDDENYSTPSFPDEGWEDPFPKEGSEKKD